MTAFAFDALGWWFGEVEDDTPRSVPIAPPQGYDGDPVAGQPWPRWCRYEWRIEDYSPPDAPAVPDEVEMWRAHCALIAAGKMAAVRAGIASIADPTARALAEAQFEYRPTVRRLSPLTQQLQQLAGITDEERDALFVQAAAL